MTLTLNNVTLSCTTSWPALQHIAEQLSRNTVVNQPDCLSLGIIRILDEIRTIRRRLILDVIQTLESRYPNVPVSHSDIFRYTESRGPWWFDAEILFDFIERSLGPVAHQRAVTSLVTEASWFFQRLGRSTCVVRHSENTTIQLILSQPVGEPFRPLVSVEPRHQPGLIAIWKLAAIFCAGAEAPIVQPPRDFYRLFQSPLVTNTTWAFHPALFTFYPDRRLTINLPSGSATDALLNALQPTQ